MGTGESIGRGRVFEGAFDRNRESPRGVLEWRDG